MLLNHDQIMTKMIEFGISISSARNSLCDLAPRRRSGATQRTVFPGCRAECDISCPMMV